MPTYNISEFEEIIDNNPMFWDAERYQKHIKRIEKLIDDGILPQLSYELISIEPNKTKLYKCMYGDK